MRTVGCLRGDVRVERIKMPEPKSELEEDESVHYIVVEFQSDNVNGVDELEMGGCAEEVELKFAKLPHEHLEITVITENSTFRIVMANELFRALERFIRKIEGDE